MNEFISNGFCLYWELLVYPKCVKSVKNKNIYNKYKNNLLIYSSIENTLVLNLLRICFIIRYNKTSRHGNDCHERSFNIHRSLELEGIVCQIGPQGKHQGQSGVHGGMRGKHG